MKRRRLSHFLTLTALLLVAFAWYWLFWRPLPETSGDLSAPVTAEARIVRDGLGVPHIQAGNLTDAYFLQGYATAQDRLWQMDAMRRLAAGELSEVLGEATVPLDRETRRLGLRRAAERQIGRLSPQDRLALSAYARGVNFLMQRSRGQLPVEFTLLRYEPRPWTVLDSMMIGLIMFRDMTSTYEDDLLAHALARLGNPAKVQALFAVPRNTEAPGSNAWALSGKLTASGKPLLANDPHLRFSAPCPWHMVELRTPEGRVTGATITGLPTVMIGHNDHIAWGFTNSHFDVQDLYRERLSPQAASMLVDNQLQPVQAITEHIAVKDKAAEELALWQTTHGPLWDGQHSLRWTALDDDAFQLAFPELNRARNWQEFRQALRRFVGPALNFVYADTTGNIGYQLAGRLPIRQQTGDKLIDGSRSMVGWQGYIPYEELPSVLNPTSGMVVSANQNSFPDDYPYRVNGNFATPHRARQIQQRLKSRKGWRAEEMVAIQKDVYSGFAHEVARATVAAFNRRSSPRAVVRRAIEVLRPWNGQMEKGTAAPLVATYLIRAVQAAIVENAAPGYGQREYGLASPSLVEALLRQRPAAWFRDYDRMLLTALEKALAEGAPSQGKDPATWDYGVDLEFSPAHPVLSNIPVIGSLFRMGPVPMSGSPTTIKQTTDTLGPSLRYVADLSNWDQSLLNLTLGESAHVFSGHYSDQWWPYYGGTSLPLPYSKVEDKRVLRVKPM